MDIPKPHPPMKRIEPTVVTVKTETSKFIKPVICVCDHKQNQHSLISMACEKCNCVVFKKKPYTPKAHLTVRPFSDLKTRLNTTNSK